MNLLHLILVVLLGLLAPSMAAVPHQMADGFTGNTDLDHNGDRTSSKVPRALEGMLLDYEIQCDSDPDTTEPPPGFKQGKVLSNKFCRDWWECNSEGKEPHATVTPIWHSTLIADCTACRQEETEAGSPEGLEAKGPVLGQGKCEVVSLHPLPPIFK